MMGKANGVGVASTGAMAGTSMVPAVPLVVDHVAKSYEVDGKIVPVAVVRNGRTRPFSN